MKVNSVGQENTSNTLSVLKAGAMGAAAGALVRNLAPITTDEYDSFFNSAAKASIAKKAKDARLFEISNIETEFKAGKLNVANDAYDTFIRSKDAVADSPKKALDAVKDASDAIKEGFTSLVKRVDIVGAAKERIETNNIKSAAKSTRPLAYFAIAGGLIAMSAQVMVNAFNSCLPKPEKKQEPQEPLTMADVLLEGLGANTEILFLTTETDKSDQK